MSDNCIFCKIIDGKIPSEKILDTAEYIVIRDISPQAPTHLLCIPKTHVASLNHMGPTERQKLLPALYSAADEAAKKQGFQQQGYRTVINNQTLAGQTVFHLHMHVLSGAPLGHFGTDMISGRA